MNEQDSRDIKPMIESISPAWWSYLLIISAILLAAAIAFWIYRKRKGMQITLPDSPETVFLRGLSALKDTDNPLKEKCFLLSLLIRNYIEKKTAYPATDKTLEELKFAFERDRRVYSRPDHDLFSGTKIRWEILMDILERCDEVKFAASTMSDHEFDSFLQKCREEIQDNHDNSGVKNV